MDTAPSIPRFKLLELPMLELSGSSIDITPLLTLALLFLLALHGLLSAKRKWLWRLCVQSLSLFMFVFAAHQTMCVLRSWVFGFQAVGKNDTIAFALLHIAVALVFIALLGGAIFCGWLCPVGALQEWLGRLSSWAKEHIDEKRSFYLDFALSILVILMMVWLAYEYAPANFFFSENVSIIFTVIGFLGLPLLLLIPSLDQKFRRFRYVSLFGRLAIILIGIHTTNPGCTIYETEVDYSAAISFLGVIVATGVLSRAYCRYICPFGGVFGLFSRVSLLKIRHENSPCKRSCGRCKQVCPVGALKEGEVDDSACIRCGRCLENCQARVDFDFGGDEN